MRRGPKPKISDQALLSAFQNAPTAQVAADQIGLSYHRLRQRLVAMGCWEKKSRGGIPDAKKGDDARRHSKNPVATHELQRLYDEAGSLHRVGERVGMSHEGVRLRLKKAGVYEVQGQGRQKRARYCPRCHRFTGMGAEFEGKRCDSCRHFRPEGDGTHWGDLRRRLGLTQSEFAARVGVSVLTIHRWEHDLYRPSALHRKQLIAMEQEQAPPKMSPIPIFALELDRRPKECQGCRRTRVTYALLNEELDECGNLCSFCLIQALGSENERLTLTQKGAR